ncbi:hypothetical protein CXG81DRAFT_27296 [Caulochytrium protostelioides]|uniref:BRCA1/BRCA2-containing complex subunit 45 n=1 Tax=Caulochytrium protostelioides TaxID=1555241 RepID=A0A4V1IUB5_9FUNG|nr:hypothetical protein CXG81DRAFT_27296 [Caulochytrium protostelioides]|eukprot:RKO99978.1 hypothetical protein CXG81DRAFT_27296 [Caulochytrium protostelioides]
MLPAPSTASPDARVPPILEAAAAAAAAPDVTATVAGAVDVNVAADSPHATMNVDAALPHLARVITQLLASRPEYRVLRSGTASAGDVLREQRAARPCASAASPALAGVESGGPVAWVTLMRRYPGELAPSTCELKLAYVPLACDPTPMPTPAGDIDGTQETEETGQWLCAMVRFAALQTTPGAADFDVARDASPLHELVAYLDGAWATMSMERTRLACDALAVWHHGLDRAAVGPLARLGSTVRHVVYALIEAQLRFPELRLDICFPIKQDADDADDGYGDAGGIARKQTFAIVLTRPCRTPALSLLAPAAPLWQSLVIDLTAAGGTADDADGIAVAVSGLDRIAAPERDFLQRVASERTTWRRLAAGLAPNQDGRVAVAARLAQSDAVWEDEAARLLRLRARRRAFLAALTAVLAPHVLEWNSQTCDFAAFYFERPLRPRPAAAPEDPRMGGLADADVINRRGMLGARVHVHLSPKFPLVPPSVVLIPIHYGVLPLDDHDHDHEATMADAYPDARCVTIDAAAWQAHDDMDQRALALRQRITTEVWRIKPRRRH